MKTETKNCSEESRASAKFWKIIDKKNQCQQYTPEVCEARQPFSHERGREAVQSPLTLKPRYHSLQGLTLKYYSPLQFLWLRVHEAPSCRRQTTRRHEKEVYL